MQAPGATIVVAVCGDSDTTEGFLIALENYVDYYSPQIIGISYGYCEASLGLGGNSVLYDTYQQAAVEGFSVFVAAGDGGAAGCDYTNGNTYATEGISISGYASTPFTVAVGGTTFGDWLLGNPGHYWKSSNGKYHESAKSYIPEIPWNSSCGNYLLAIYYDFTQTYGSSGFCSSEFQTGALLRFMAGSGGPSACALVAPQGSGCAGYGKPGWQDGILGNPDDQVRDVPDVSIIAGGAEWGHGLAYCYSFNSNSGCTAAPTLGGSGTSFSAPIFAGVQALIDQHAVEQVGNPNPTYYTLASSEYGQNGNLNCFSMNAVAGNSCVFYDVANFDMANDSTTAVPCMGANDCYFPSGDYGVLSTDDSSYAPAYASQPGWDFTTGIGTPNVTNLIDAWPIP